MFPSANKLFSLSQEHQIGIMVFGAATHFGVPWETLFKTYRSDVVDRKIKFKNIDESAQDFIHWLQLDRPIPMGVQYKGFLLRVELYYDRIWNMLEGAISEMESVSEPMLGDSIAQRIREKIEGERNRWRDASFIEAIKDDGKQTSLTPFSDKDIEDCLESHRDRLREIMAESFEKLPLPGDLEEMLLWIGAAMPFKWPDDWQTELTSGIVFAGFCEGNVFPAMCCYLISGAMNDMVWFKRDGTRCGSISFDTPSTICPFAQGEMVLSFLEGAEPDYQAMVSTLLEDLAFDLIRDVRAGLGSILDSGTQTELLEDIAGVFGGRFQSLWNSMRDQRDSRFTTPVLELVADLDKSDLAELAKSLVSLTSLKKRYKRGEAETVGGPIDVAVISRGDGFVWIERKHYFDAKLNPHFIAKYYG